VHLLVSEQYIDSIMHGATIKVVMNIRLPKNWLNMLSSCASVRRSVLNIVTVLLTTKLLALITL